jgi:TolA-binding protein
LRTKELTEVQNRVDSLRNDIFTIDDAWQARNEEAVSYKIAMEMMLNRMNVMLEQLSGNVTESQVKISEIDKKTGIISSQMAEKARQDSLQESIKEQERIGLFNLAKSNYDSGKFSVAINDFNDYIQKYPNSEDAKTALFWIAEANFATESLDAAEKTFKQYYTENRDEKSACLALYKMGLIYEKQQKTKSRDAVWGQLNKQCPNSEEAKLVKENQKK